MWTKYINDFGFNGRGIYALCLDNQKKKKKNSTHLSFFLHHVGSTVYAQFTRVYKMISFESLGTEEKPHVLAS